MYYYGARYYSSRENLWISVDPLIYDGTFWSGKHNNGFLNSFNHGSYSYCYQNPINLIDPNGKQTVSPITQPTNSVQINSAINNIAKDYPNSPIYLLIQSSPIGIANDRQNANTGNISFNIHTIQDQSTNPNIDLTNGSFYVTLTHGQNLITGSIIEEGHTNEVTASFSISFVGDPVNGVGGADNLTTGSTSQIPLIANLINNTNQNVVINSSTPLTGTGPINANTQRARALMNGVTGIYNANDFGNARISTVINALTGAGVNSNNVSRGTPTFYRSVDGGRNGTFIDFTINNSFFTNGTNMGSGPVNIDKSKFQIY